MSEEKKVSETNKDTETPDTESENAPEGNNKLKQLLATLMADKKRFIAAVVAVVIVLSALIGVAVWWKHTREAKLAQKGKAVTTSASAEDEDSEFDAKHPPIFLPIDRIVVKLRRGSAPVDHYLQVAINLRLASPEVNEKIAQLLPIIQNDMVLILSSKEFGGLDSTEQKMKLANELRDAANKVLKTTPHEGVRAVYFESFILQ